jgi:DNA-binding transcriptional ArsR family regulator
MVNQSVALDRVFSALADATRRSLVERLILGPASVGDLARPLAMSLPAVMQHLAVLESAGLIGSEKVGRVRTCHAESAAIRSAEAWISQQRTAWEHRLDALDAALAAPADDPASADPASADPAAHPSQSATERTTS